MYIYLYKYIISRNIYINLKLFYMIKYMQEYILDILKTTKQQKGTYCYSKYTVINIWCFKY